MTISLYDTVALVQIVENLKEPSSFTLDRFFPRSYVSTTEYVALDVYDGKRRLAPFVNPLQEGKIVEVIGMRTPTFKPPYIKPKVRLDPTRPIRRAIGERIGGAELTPVQREAANLVFEITEQVNMINRRLEWMAVQAMATGTLTVQGEGVPLTSISFGRAAGNTVALTGAARWGQTGVAPTDNIDAWSAVILQACGFAATDIVFTPTAWRLFRADPKVASIVGSLVNGQPNFAAAGVPAMRGGQFLGNWGPYNLWLYYEWYVDPVDNTEKPMMADGTVLMGSPDIDGMRAFATIMDTELGYPSMPYAPKSWTTPDPSARWLMLQSAPIVIPSRVNASFSATVI
jgi:hypothetical protein